MSVQTMFCDGLLDQNNNGSRNRDEPDIMPGTACRYSEVVGHLRCKTSETGPSQT